MYTIRMMKNLYDISDLPVDAGEIFDDVLVYQDVRIERIVSFGDATPVGQWYDQSWGEWVLVLSGSADMTVFVAGVATCVTLRRGDRYFFAPHQKHRVERTDTPTIWLAIHFENPQ